MVQRKETFNVIMPAKFMMFVSAKFMDLAPLKLLAFNVGGYSNDCFSAKSTYTTKGSKENNINIVLVYIIIIMIILLLSISYTCEHA